MVRKNAVTSRITLEHLDGRSEAFDLEIRYETPAHGKYLEIYRLAMTMPVLNYGLFTDSIILGFPVSESDLALLNDMLEIFSKDIFVNKLARRRTGHLNEEFLPTPEEVIEKNARPRATIKPKEILPDKHLPSKVEPAKVGILSSGGKEALLGYSMLKELGADVHPLYVNESGGHWRTALTAYRWHKANEPNTGRVWTNIDRYYLFMLDNLKIVKKHHRRITGDTYPIRLCIFPVYLFQLLPIYLDRGIGNLLIGDEFDDPRGEWTYNGIKHYFGIYDQHIDFDFRMEEWYSKRIPGMSQWSALRPISGLIVERILTKRYKDAAKYQRSCHSCHFDGDDIVPCGECTKCLGVMLFLKANGQDPEMMGYRPEDVEALQERLIKTKLRLDPDELEHSISRAFILGFDIQWPKRHVGGIHIHGTCDTEMIPEQFRAGIMAIIGEYANGRWVLVDGEWEKI
ncbi:MAG: metal-binding protein [Thermoplasmata archaeon]|nr:metal-binding protein [Thermoplasmata archaeon]